MARFGKKKDDRDDEQAPGADLADAIAREREEYAKDLMERGASHKEYERRLAKRLRDSSVEQLGGAAGELSYALGGARPGEARVAALERLAELHASGRITEEQFSREKRRLLAEG